jgi:hypothetical protein
MRVTASVAMLRVAPGRNLDDELLDELVRQELVDQPRHQVRGAARRLAEDLTDRGPDRWSVRA